MTTVRSPPAAAVPGWLWTGPSCATVRRPAVMRRVWAGSVSEALEAMVADRRTDETLEQIERGAVADGVLWPE